MSSGNLLFPPSTNNFIDFFTPKGNTFKEQFVKRAKEPLVYLRNIIHFQLLCIIPGP